MLNKQEMVELTEATLLQAGINPDTKKSVDKHNLEAKKQAEKLLPKFEKLLEIIHNVVKTTSKKRTLGVSDIKAFNKAIDNTKAGDFQAEGGIPLENKVLLYIQEQNIGMPIQKYIEKHLLDLIDINVFMKESIASEAIDNVSQTIQKLKNTIEGTTSVITTTKTQSDKVLNV